MNARPDIESSAYHALLLALSILLFLWCPPSSAAETWQARDLSVEMGSAVPLTSGLKVSPNESGQVYIALPPRGLDLARHHLLTIEFADRPPPVIFLIWNNHIRPQQLYQRRLPLQRQNPVVFDMGEVDGWEGSATRLGIGLRLPPDSQLVIRSITLGSPNLLTMARAAWQNWSDFRPWKQVDINVHTGTRQFGQGPHPMPVFAIFCLFGVAAYFLLSRLLHKQFNLRIVGGLILCTWLLLDLLWQFRLAQQLTHTLQTFGGLQSEEKLLASQDGELVRFVAAARDKIPDDQARVFIASASDGKGMRGAYYMSPLNTYWHRKGPELPDSANLAAGDYLLVIAPSEVRYDPVKGRLRYRNNPPVAIETLLRDSRGLLLRVKE